MVHAVGGKIGTVIVGSMAGLTAMILATGLLESFFPGLVHTTKIVTGVGLMTASLFSVVYNKIGK